MTRARRDLVRQYLDHYRRLQPGVRDENRVHPCRFLRDLEARESRIHLTPALVRKTGSELCDGPELILVAVVDAGEQSASSELRALAFAPVEAEQDDVDGVVELAAGVPLQLHPVEVARARLIGRVKALGHDPLEALADEVEQFAGEHLNRIGLRERRCKQRVRTSNQLLNDLEASLVGQRRQVGSVLEHDVENECA